MADYLLLGGVALCVISVIVAVIQLLQTVPPRSAAILLVLGIAAIFSGAYLAPQPFDLAATWARVTGGEASAPEN